MRFADIDYDLAILDKYLELTDQELRINPNTEKLDVYQKQYIEFRFDDDKLSFTTMIEYLVDLAQEYFTYHYECFGNDDYFRQCVYLHHLQLARRWQGVI